MSKTNPRHGLSTLANHAGEGDHPQRAHVAPIYQTSTFTFPDAETGGRIYAGEESAFYYSRAGNPNAAMLAHKIAVLEGLDLLRESPETPVESLVAGRAFSSGMAAITTAILGRVQPGEAVIALRCAYGNTFGFLDDNAAGMGIQTVWLDDADPQAWEAAFAAHPNATLAYCESPTNPTLDLVDLAALAEIAHRHGAWVMVDNTFATPYHQRPLSLGCDVVVHSTTKYLSGHGQVIGGAVVSPHLDYMHPRGKGIGRWLKLGGAPSPFDCWLAASGLKTFPLRMKAHNENAARIVEFLGGRPEVARVYYPGLPGHPGHAVAARQMHNGFGGMVAFELAGGMQAGIAFMNRLRLITRAVSLGTVDTLIEHPASMTHARVPAQERAKAGIRDGLLRLSVGIEDVEDLIGDLDGALGRAA